MRRMMMGMAALAALASGQPASADTVTDWWEFANKIAPYMATSGTPEQGRAVTRASLAMFEAVNAIDRRYESYLDFPAGDPTASQDAAAATAAYTVMLHHFPTQKTALDDGYMIAMAGIADERAREAGRLIGEQAARAAIAAGGIDPALQPTPYRPRTTPGAWVATALPQIEPHMVTYRPWAIPSADALRPPPPVALASERWARDYEEVRRLGGRTSTERTPYQTLMARYRQAFDLTPTMRLVADGPGRSQVQNARMFAIYQMTFDDAAMAMADAKAHYDFWRPITAIRNGGDDGNDATPQDAAWVPLLGTPNFAEYPCGHCVIAAAHAEVMTAETGPRPATGVRVAAMAVPMSAVQVLPSWDEWEQEVSDSRIYGGVHFRFSNEAGQQIGRRAARIVLDSVMRPLPGR
ncbi:vanadium-dependent haloperoxidase [Brevundimonas sp.]|uniref:vanadium-dependent haloperoxidase n=1 Tax=Brevundimonas sp. TaxID=1871086 RepID=UPI002D249F27|nr:vanadium-dependent haloperoxidase [Brevundimonas sp.]HYC75169.1 vanadium-dependent haloperoxidase [Brevundimonas sp.]